MEKSRPHVILSAAISIDGKIATRLGDSKLSSKKDKIRLHRLRSKVDAILVGKNTIHRDDPLLTVRYVKGKNPTRIILSFLEDSFESPKRVAIFPSIEIAALRITCGLDFSMYYFTSNHYSSNCRFRCSMYNRCMWIMHWL